MHGHSYHLEVAVRGPLQAEGPARGMIVDFDEIKRIVRQAAIDPLDHRTLNELIENPTAERIVLWIWERLMPILQGLDELVLWETSTSCAVLRASDFHDASARLR
jgi:6-pyruvoyltetrahydropterin/6-carboxytetrahydropterin synthase